MRSSLLGVAFLFSSATWASCPIPASYDLKRVQYSLESIHSSVTVVLDFPRLSTLPCDTQAVLFGDLWKFKLGSAEAIQVNVMDLNGVRVQQFQILGEIELKTTSTWTALRFFKAVFSKGIADHRIESIELKNSLATTGPLVFAKEPGSSRTFPATLVFYN